MFHFTECFFQDNFLLFLLSVPGWLSTSSSSTESSFKGALRSHIWPIRNNLNNLVEKGTHCDLIWLFNLQPHRIQNFWYRILYKCCADLIYVHKVDISALIPSTKRSHRCKNCQFTIWKWSHFLQKGWWKAQLVGRSGRKHVLPLKKQSEPILVTDQKRRPSSFYRNDFHFPLKLDTDFIFIVQQPHLKKKKIQPSYVQLFDVFSSFHICQICKIFPSRRFCPNIGMPTFPQPFSFLCRDRRLHPRQIIIRWWWDCNLIKKRIQNLWILILTIMRGCSYIT